MSTDYSPLVTAAANRYGVPPALALAVMQQESGGNPNAISSKGAIGLFQLMPNTAAGLGVNPQDPLQNIDGGVRYLSQLLGQYQGDTSLALAAYNAGPGAVNKYGGIPPFAETQNYISSILAKIGGWIGIDSASIPAAAASVPATDQYPGPSTADSSAATDLESVILGTPPTLTGAAIVALALTGIAVIALFITDGR